MKNKKSRKKTTSVSIFTIILVLITFIYSTFTEEINSSFGLPNGQTTTITESNNTLSNSTNNVEVSFLDVGQADSILISSSNEYMLIDAGNNSDGPLLVKYFQDLGIQEFKYVVGTHPHEDHIGGLDDIINSFNIDKIYLPDAITTTKTFEDVLDAIDNKNKTYTVPKIDSTFDLGDATFKVIYTGTDTSDLNNTSIVLKMTYKNVSFLFTGDTTSKNEQKILNKDINSTVLKVGHHGSKYSSSNAFLDKVNPKYAIIEVGQNNIYKHPSEETLSKLKRRNITTYRTDESGSIIAKTDGNKINFSAKKTNTNGG